MPQIYQRRVAPQLGPDLPEDRVANQNVLGFQQFADAFSSGMVEIEKRRQIREFNNAVTESTRDLDDFMLGLDNDPDYDTYGDKLDNRMHALEKRFMDPRILRGRIAQESYKQWHGQTYEKMRVQVLDRAGKLQRDNDLAFYEGQIQEAERKGDVEAVNRFYDSMQAGNLRTAGDVSRLRDKSLRTANGWRNYGAIDGIFMSRVQAENPLVVMKSLMGGIDSGELAPDWTPEERRWWKNLLEDKWRSFISEAAEGEKLFSSQISSFMMAREYDVRRGNMTYEEAFLTPVEELGNRQLVDLIFDPKTGLSQGQVASFTRWSDQFQQQETERIYSDEIIRLTNAYQNTGDITLLTDEKEGAIAILQLMLDDPNVGRETSARLAGLVNGVAAGNAHDAQMMFAVVAANNNQLSWADLVPQENGRLRKGLDLLSAEDQRVIASILARKDKEVTDERETWAEAHLFNLMMSNASQEEFETTLFGYVNEGVQLNGTSWMEKYHRRDDFIGGPFGDALRTSSEILNENIRVAEAKYRELLEDDPGMESPLTQDAQRNLRELYENKDNVLDRIMDLSAMGLTPDVERELESITGNLIDENVREKLDAAAELSGKALGLNRDIQALRQRREKPVSVFGLEIRPLSRLRQIATDARIGGRLDTLDALREEAMLNIEAAAAATRERHIKGELQGTYDLLATELPDLFFTSFGFAPTVQELSDPYFVQFGKPVPEMMDIDGIPYYPDNESGNLALVDGIWYTLSISDGVLDGYSELFPDQKILRELDETMRAASE